MVGILHLLPVVVLCVVHRVVCVPQADVYAQYPNGAFDDPVPNNDHNDKFKEYAAFLTRFDPWVTGQKVPIPADPNTDALHQDLPPEAASLGSTRVVRAPVSFDDPVPLGSETNPAYNEYIRELTRYDPWVSGSQADGHAVYKREQQATSDEKLISEEKDFGANVEVKAPVESETANPAYGSFIQELKRYDPWLVGHNVTIPHNETADQQWDSDSDQ
ncbi:uncharacterized protein LOC118465655 [Anopheles albimanus]|uniref:Uncharacterized protein n=1 Tax=Anopheles albimanus TaxID=7167 RepID=A0A182FCN1_ANOAL|nr:uncharacterized protein LOC118465655 [Anopheles albimanus]